LKEESQELWARSALACRFATQSPRPSASGPVLVLDRLIIAIAIAIADPSDLLAALDFTTAGHGAAGERSRQPIS
jgi:hypothetical protein